MDASTNCASMPRIGRMPRTRPLRAKTHPTVLANGLGILGIQKRGQETEKEGEGAREREKGERGGEEEKRRRKKKKKGRRKGRGRGRERETEREREEKREFARSERE